MKITKLKKGNAILIKEQNKLNLEKFRKFSRFTEAKSSTNNFCDKAHIVTIDQIHLCLVPDKNITAKSILTARVVPRQARCSLVLVLHPDDCFHWHFCSRDGDGVRRQVDRLQRPERALRRQVGPAAAVRRRAAPLAAVTWPSRKEATINKCFHNKQLIIPCVYMKI